MTRPKKQTSKKTKTSKKRNNFLKKHFIDMVLVLGIILCAIYFLYGREIIENVNYYLSKEDIESEISESEIKSIGELATLKAYYHNVAEYNQDSAGVFKYGLFQYGYKKCWIEYDGIVQMGVDANQIQVQQPDENNVVQIYMPEAQVLSVDADENSISDPITEAGKFTKITLEEKNQAYANAQTEMEEDAKKDTRLLNKAQSNAKKMIENYVKKIDENYEVKWIENPS